MDLFSFREEEWFDHPIEWLAPFRVRQLFHWFHHRGIWDYSEMDNSPLSLRKRLSEEFPVESVHIYRWISSREDETKKILFQLPDNNIVEGVLLSYRHGLSFCISTQVGCAMGCRFCASTLGGKVRNISRSEMLQMFYLAQREFGKKITHLVLMGSGEPLDNLEEVKGFLDILTHPKGQDMSWRNVTISTSGLVDGIEQLIVWRRPLTLAVSLHSARQEIRSELMPIAKKWNIQSVVEAAFRYQKISGRRVSFEVSLIEGVNDTKEDLQMLIQLLQGKGAHVNLINLNPTQEQGLVSSSSKRLQHFKKSLEAVGIHATIRREMGRDIQGACGQLRNSVLEENTRRNDGKSISRR